MCNGIFFFAKKISNSSLNKLPGSCDAIKNYYEPNYAIMIPISEIKFYNNRRSAPIPFRSKASL